MSHTWEKITSEKEVDDIHIFALLNSLCIQDHFQGSESFEEGAYKVHGWWPLWELGFQTLFQVIEWNGSYRMSTSMLDIDELVHHLRYVESSFLLSIFWARALIDSGVTVYDNENIG